MRQKEKKKRQSGGRGGSGEMRAQTTLCACPTDRSHSSDVSILGRAQRLRAKWRNGVETCITLSALTSGVCSLPLVPMEQNNSKLLCSAIATQRACLQTENIAFETTVLPNAKTFVCVGKAENGHAAYHV